VCAKGFNKEVGAFTQSYGSKNLDASLLMMALVGFLPADDPRVVGTIKAIEEQLVSKDGFVMRYTPDKEVDGLPEGEATFLPCTLWLADNYAVQGRKDEATALFERALSICNDVGLLSEEYDPKLKRFAGNFPQALSHLGLVNTAYNLAKDEESPARKRKAS
jgi:GH15 family glucan-1,4-alpha-glucosidase